jgi:hypothetical protein
LEKPLSAPAIDKVPVSEVATMLEKMVNVICHQETSGSFLAASPRLASICVG